MKIDAGGYCSTVDQAGSAAQAAELAGYGALVTRIRLTVPADGDPDRWRGLLESLRAG